ncbi:MULTISPECIES: lysis protein [unclassified Pantoea]|uniref:lysis protein n=1 Tax=unclassified Pantoea TaxID=2630326 RepID=UPI002477BD19|nr:MULTISPECIES: lysis protein [unclassified Pantoea]GME31047.1 lysis protein [Pantoea sp. QMID3]GME31300.1 lysis protein [Pantoea sp. QMID1]GME51349.1 lysis protein [Pantoea sp. QMID4]GME52560.1 lysis protein [Pantoea sp. QMID2]
MTSKAKVLTALILLVLIVLATSVAFALYYRANAIDYKAQRDTATSALKLAKDTITDMQTRQRDVAALDAKYTKELADAQATIDQLHDDVATGKRRLQLNVTCAKQSATGTSGVGDDATASLTADAERNYWRLRNGISTITNQVTYLQDYINRICLK